MVKWSLNIVVKIASYIYFRSYTFAPYRIRYRKGVYSGTIRLISRHPSSWFSMCLQGATESNGEDAEEEGSPSGRQF